MNRREFLIEGGKWLALSTGLNSVLTACKDSSRVSAPAVEPNQEESWRQTSPAERLKRLERRMFPQFNSFNLHSELTLAAAQLRLEVTYNTKTLDEMVQAVNIVPHDVFADVFAKSHDGKRPADNPGQGNVAIEFVDPKTFNTIYIDEDMLKRSTTLFFSQRVRDSLKQNGVDFEIALLKEIIIHAQSHMNQTREKLVFDEPIQLGIPDTDQKLEVRELDGLFIEMNNLNGQGFSVGGISETFTQIATEFITSKAGAYVRIAPYRLGEDLINPLLTEGKVTTEQVLEIYHGQKSQTELLNMIGGLQRGVDSIEKTTSQRDVGMKVLAVIGLTVDGIIPQRSASLWIERMYGRRIY